MYTLLGADGVPYSSETPGTLGGNSKLRIYGRLDCWSARNALGKGYEQIRVFFDDEATAIAAGYRPCGHCMKDKYRRWKDGQSGTS
jgi:methylphosphotriester-DNA--protein-cysteine methyltransferase